MTSYEEGQRAYQQGYLIKENPYSASEMYLQRCQWNRGYSDVRHRDGQSKSVLQKLSHGGIVDFYRKGDIVFAQGYGKICLDKKDLIELRSFLDRWIGESPRDLNQ